jgi:excisionase family DNA binding protein
VTRIQGRELVVPTDHDVSLAADASRTLAARAGTDGCEWTMTVGGTGEAVQLPAAAVRLLLAILSELGSGNAVALDTVPPDLSGHRAADLLHVSHVYFLKLLDDGALPFRTEGTHRRVRRADVLAYKADFDAQRFAAMAELTTLSQEMGLYDPPPK